MFTYSLLFCQFSSSGSGAAGLFLLVAWSGIFKQKVQRLQPWEDIYNSMWRQRYVCVSGWLIIDYVNWGDSCLELWNVPFWKGHFSALNWSTLLLLPSYLTDNQCFHTKWSSFLVFCWELFYFFHLSSKFLVFVYNHLASLWFIYLWL